MCDEIECDFNDFTRRKVRHIEIANRKCGENGTEEKKIRVRICRNWKCDAKILFDTEIDPSCRGSYGLAGGRAVSMK